MQSRSQKNISDYLKHYVIFEGLATNFQVVTWSGCLGNVVSSDVVYSNPREYIFSDYQMMFGCSQDSTLSLGVPRGSKSQLLEDSQHKGQLAVLDWSFPVRLKSVLLQLSFPADEISRMQSIMLKVFVSQKHTAKRLVYQNMVIFNRRNLAFALFEYLSFFHWRPKKSRNQMCWVSCNCFKG